MRNSAIPFIYCIPFICCNVAFCCGTMHMHATVLPLTTQGWDTKHLRNVTQGQRLASDSAASSPPWTRTAPETPHQGPLGNIQAGHRGLPVSKNESYGLAELACHRVQRSVPHENGEKCQMSLWTPVEPSHVPLISDAQRLGRYFHTYFMGLSVTIILEKFDHFWSYLFVKTVLWAVGQKKKNISGIK